MVIMEQRLAFLETTVLKQGEAQAAVRADLAGLGQRATSRLARIDEHVVHLDARLRALDDTLARRFAWSIGIHVTALAVLAGVLIARG